MQGVDNQNWLSTPWKPSSNSYIILLSLTKSNYYLACATHLRQIKKWTKKIPAESIKDILKMNKTS